MDANVSQEAASQSKRSVWLTNIYHFFHLPNAKIFTLFIISSTATFFFGVAMIVQWAFYSQHHPDFRSMVYSASAVTSLPILIWIIVLLFAIHFHASSSSSSSNLPKPQQSHAYQPTDTEAAAAPKGDELTMVQPEILDHHPSGLIEEQQPESKTLIPVSQPRHSSVDDNKQALTRALSLPLSQIPTDYRNFNRTMSLKQ